jgi:deoxyribodipyrimidine photo-lyase
VVLSFSINCMADLILFWHRRDLRIVDNIGLAAARQRSPRVVGIFCLDPLLLERDDVAPARVAYMMGSLQELQEQYATLRSQLLILHALPQQAIPALATALKAKAVFLNQDVEPYSHERDRAVTEALQAEGIEVHAFWDQLLHAPREVMAGGGQPYTVYTPYWRNWRARPKASPVAALAGVEGLTPVEQTQATQAGAIALPTAEGLGFIWPNELPLKPGYQAAQNRLEEFCDGDIFEYAEQRNYPALRGTSQLSAALKFGTIGIRTVWAATEAAARRSRSDEAQHSIASWQQELAWREFYQHALYFFPELAEGAYRKMFKTFPYENNQEHFRAWCEGRTGYPIVDAAMRQMNNLAWMHNRCRMIVANFLTKDLLIDPRLGEKYFMQKLMDGDVSSNNGGWQWSASSGMDPRPLRVFNPASQAQKFDPDGDYIREWLPELRSLETEMLVTGRIPPEERDRCGYPAPIVDHKLQQSRYKAVYQQQQQKLA